MQIFFLIIGLYIIPTSIHFIIKEIKWTLNGIDDSYERARNSIRANPRRYGDELSRGEKIVNVILTVLVGAIGTCTGIASLFIGIASIINYF